MTLPAPPAIDSPVVDRDGGVEPISADGTYNARTSPRSTVGGSSDGERIFYLALAGQIRGGRVTLYQPKRRMR